LVPTFGIGIWTWICLHYTCTLTYSFWLTLLDVVNVLVSGEQYKFWICMLYNILSLPVLCFSTVHIQAL
jgi:hypothetical protein